MKKWTKRDFELLKNDPRVSAKSGLGLAQNFYTEYRGYLRRNDLESLLGKPRGLFLHERHEVCREVLAKGGKDHGIIAKVLKKYGYKYQTKLVVSWLNSYETENPLADIFTCELRKKMITGAWA